MNAFELIAILRVLMDTYYDDKYMFWVSGV